VCQLDAPAFAHALRQVAGRRFLGVVECIGCIELVFDADAPGGNLVSVFTEGLRAGQAALGGVTDPHEYVLAYRALRRLEASS
jgi:hypothetical protein